MEELRKLKYENMLNCTCTIFSKKKCYNSCNDLLYDICEGNIKKVDIIETSEDDKNNKIPSPKIKNITLSEVIENEIIKIEDEKYEFFGKKIELIPDKRYFPRASRLKQLLKFIINYGSN
jgi:hypothetical protein